MHKKPSYKIEAVTVSLLILALFISLLFYSYDPRRNIHEALTNTAMKEAIRDLELKYDLEDLGVCSNNDKKTHKVFFYFKREKAPSVPGARKMLLDIGKKVLRAVNANEDLEYYLEKKPLTLKDITITIFFVENQDTNKFAVASLEEKVLQYQQREKRRKPLQSFYKETYEEAIKKQRRKLNL